MNWNIDETPYPGPDEESPNLVPNPQTWHALKPPKNAKNGDVWFDTSTGQLYTKFGHLWLETK